MTYHRPFTVSIIQMSSSSSFFDSLSEESSSDDDGTDENGKIDPDQVEKIIGIDEPSFSENSKFYVKFADKSYRDCKWVTADFFNKNSRVKQLYARFLKYPMPFRQVPFMKKPPLYKPMQVEFDKGFINIERIISILKNKDIAKYLVKWESLDLSHCTWETQVPQKLVMDYQNSIIKKNLRKDPALENPRCNYIYIKESPIYNNENKLTYYQLDGLNWLQKCWSQSKNSILADEMGLGKTIQALAFLDFLKTNCKINGPFLVVAPTSTLYNWEAEVHKWTDFRSVVFSGNEKCRQIIKDYLLFYRDKKGNFEKSSLIFDILITSYEILAKELTLIKSIFFFYAIIDEAHRLKNYKSSTFATCSSIHSQQFLLLTGTPIQNNVMELWSLLHFIDPESFKDPAAFEAQFGDSTNIPAIEKLQRDILSKYILRRKKSDIKEIELPAKEETIVEIELTQIQRTIYKNIIEDHSEILMNISNNKRAMNNIMFQLRKICSHPYLIPNIEQLCLAQYKENKGIPADQNLTTEDEYNSLVLASGKTIFIDKLLPKLKEGNHKVLIFSQLTTMLDILEDYIIYKKYKYERLDGNSSLSSRNQSIERFQNDSDSFIFLLSTRAGGFGINLTVADTVIIYDSDWNPQNDIQAQARCHRFGQTKDVKVYRLLTRNTYEAEMFLRISKKLAFDIALHDNSYKSTDSEDGDIDIVDLDQIMRKGAYYTFMDNTNEIEKFCSENIDQILENRTHARKDLVSGGKSLFSNVSFDLNKDEKLNLDSKDFWSKLLFPHGMLHLPSKRIIKKIYSEESVKPKAEQKQSKNIQKKEEEEEDYVSDYDESDPDYIPSKHEEARMVNENQKYFVTKILANKFSPFSNQITPNAMKEIVIGFSRHGVVGSSRLCNLLSYTIGKSLISLAYKRLDKTSKSQFRNYIREAVGNVQDQIKSTPLPLFFDENFLSSLFAGKEKLILSLAFHSDFIYRTAIYVSNEKLPDNFQFAPSMSVPLGWTPLDDFTILGARCFVDDIDKVLTDIKLPYYQENKFISKEWIQKRINLISYELSLYIPSSYPYKEKKIQNTKFFSENNHHLLKNDKLQVLNRSLQKKLLQVLYLYGIPTKDPIRKIRTIARLPYINHESVLLFVCSVLEKCIKLNSRLRRYTEFLFENSGKTTDFSSFERISKYITSDVAQVSWIHDKAIQGLAQNLLFLLSIRQNYDYYNAHPSEMDIGPWEIFKWWDHNCDKILFNITSYYGFLHFSEFAHFIKNGKIDDNIIAQWREKEERQLSPYVEKEGYYLIEMFPFEVRMKRLSKILSRIRECQQSKI